jgi:hypothetical protein
LLSSNPLIVLAATAHAVVIGRTDTRQTRSRRLVDIVSARAREPLYRTYELRLLAAVTPVDQ